MIGLIELMAVIVGLFALIGLCAVIVGLIWVMRNSRTPVVRLILPSSRR